MTKHDQTDKTPSQAPLSTRTGRIAIYARVASGTLKTSLPQSDDLLALALKCGYSREQVIIFKDTISGNAPIAKRTALSALLRAITTPQIGEEPIKVILSLSEDRIFRDAAASDISFFIRVCTDHGVQLMTPFITYDFATASAVAQFRFHCEQSTLFIQQQLTGRLNAGKMHKRQARAQ
jgi:DNA invertase Pin-like site-specific DNA recombinase